MRSVDPEVGGEGLVATEVIDERRQGGYGKDVYTIHDGGLGLIVVGNENAAEALVLGDANHRENAVGVPD